jgi:RNA polymerase sigma factor (TIGR02999 family)
MPSRNSITDALNRLRTGKDESLDRLVPLVYDDLRRLARRQLARRPPSPTAATTDLVHELYVKLARQQPAQWRDRGHFFAAAARAMRHILIDHAKRRRRLKRGGGLRPTTLDEEQLAVEQETEQVLAVDAALTRLATLDERLARIVECRFFAGLSDEETAAALGVSERTVQRDWVRARSWLREEMTRSATRTG